MTGEGLKAYYARETGSGQKLSPEEVKQHLDAHLALYLIEPEAAHIWDPIVIGVTSGPIKALLLTYTGRKSGRTLHSVLQYFEQDGKIAVVASRGGTVDHPVWYLNLLENPECDVQRGKEAFRARARTASNEERERWWAHIVQEQPTQGVYQQRTAREIPVVILDVAER